MTEDPRAYNSPEELAELLRAMAARMHYLNRVALGESRFAWWYAELLRSAAQMAVLLKDKETQQRFGDGWQEGSGEDPRAAFLALLDKELPKR